MKTWAEKTIEKIRTSTWTEAEIRKARTILQGALQGRRQQVKVTPDEVHAVMDAIETHMPQVSDTQRDKGVAYLRTLAFRKDGTQRQTPAALQLTARDLDVIRTLDRFLLVSFQEYGDSRWPDLLPVYRAIGAGTFDYVAPSWQSGYSFHVEKHA